MPFKCLIMKEFTSKVSLLGIIFSILCINIFTQKLPSIQEKSLLAPSGVKIDGKAGEWNNRLQAHNRNTDIDYTIANDKNNLYIIIQSKDAILAKKILAGGITVRLNADGKKSDQSGVAITYVNVNSTSKSQLGMLISEWEIQGDVDKKRNQSDSIIRILNSVLNSNIKEMKVVGISALPDSIISVYNITGIKTASLFDSQRKLTCELAIPLKYLDFLVKNKPSINYHITLNGLNAAETVYVRNPQPNGPIAVTTIPRSMSGGSNSSISQIINYSTDFWGEYKLAQ
jgi:hypothetical protein